MPSNFWVSLAHEAREIERKDPIMRTILDGLFSEAGSFGDCMAGILAAALAINEKLEPFIKQEFLSVFDDEPDLLEKVVTDLKVVLERDPACSSYVLAAVSLKGFQALVAHRISHELWNGNRRDFANWISYRCSVVLGPDIHPAATLGTGIMLDHGSGIVIGETAKVGNDVSILQGVTLGGTGKETGDRHPKVDSGVMIGAGAKIIGNIRLGTRSKVAAGSVVLKDVPANCTVAGVPAQIVRQHNGKQSPAFSMDQSV